MRPISVGVAYRNLRHAVGELRLLALQRGNRQLNPWGGPEVSFWEARGCLESRGLLAITALPSNDAFLDGRGFIARNLSRCYLILRPVTSVRVYVRYTSLQIQVDGWLKRGGADFAVIPSITPITLLFPNV